MLKEPRVSPTQLDPLPFAMESRFRFVVLIALSITISLALGLSVIPAFVSSSEGIVPCLSGAINAQFELASQFDPEGTAVAHATKRLAQCLTVGPGIPGIVIPIAFAVLHLSLTVLIRKWETRRILRPIDVTLVETAMDDSNQDAEVHRRLDEVHKALDCTRRPILHWRDGGKDDIHCFGSNRAPRIVIGRQNREYLDSDPERLEALLGHECSHIVSGDVSQRAWFNAFWIAHLYAIVPLFVLSIGIRYAREDTFRLVDVVASGARLFIASALLYLAVLSVYRSWERLADFRAGTVMKWRNALMELHLDEAAEDASEESGLSRAGRMIRRIWRRFLQPHPPAAERAAYLRNSNAFFTVQQASVFAYSLALGACIVPWVSIIIIGGATASTNESAVPFNVGLLVVFISLVAASFALVGSITLSVWRSFLQYDLKPTSSRPSFWRPALYAALGLVAGFAISLFGGSVFAPFGLGPDLPWESPEASNLMVVVLPVLFFLLFYALFRWQGGFGHAWDGRIARRSWGGRLVTPLFLVSSIPYVLLIPVFVMLVCIGVGCSGINADGEALLTILMRNILEGIGLEVDIPPVWLPLAHMAMLLTVLLWFNPLTIVAAVVLALTPLAAQLIGHEPPPYKSWILHEGRGEDEPRVANIWPVVMLGGGLLGGIVVAIFLWWPLTGVAFSIVGVDPGNTVLVVLVFWVAVALMHAFVSFAVAAIVPDSRFAHGVAAGLIASFILTAYGFYVHGSDDDTLSTIMWANTFVLGALAICPIGAILGSGVGRFVAARSKPTDVVPKDRQQQVSWRTAMVMLFVGAMVTVSMQQIAPDGSRATASDTEALPRIE